MTAIRSVLLDRDGTLIYDRHYLKDPAGVELLPGVTQGLHMLAERQASFFLATNQSGIGRGMFSAKDYLACHERLVELLEACGLCLADAAYCPHAPEEKCLCRKPGTAMWQSLKHIHRLTPESSAMIGDKMVDIAFGHAAQLSATVLVLTGKGLAEAHKHGLPVPGDGQSHIALTAREPHWPHAVAHDLRGAAHYLVE